VIGGLAETQEMLDFYADKGIVAEIEMALLAVMHEGGVHWVQVLRRWRSDHQACLHSGLVKKTE
jgi:hypothetical protein